MWDNFPFLNPTNSFLTSTSTPELGFEEAGVEEVEVDFDVLAFAFEVEVEEGFDFFDEGATDFEIGAIHSTCTINKFSF